MFTGHQFAEGAQTIINTLKQQNVKASFFFTGDFYRNPSFKNYIRQLKQNGHYLGAHSDKHLLYADWTKRDSLLVTKAQFNKDLLDNYREMERFGVKRKDAQYFLPPFEWYNDSIAAWTTGLNLQLINYTPGTISHADYTTPDLKNYRSSVEILKSIYNQNLNGFILLMHIGAGPQRHDKLHDKLPELLTWLKAENYRCVRIDELLKH